ncbi:hypothetical protein [Desulfosarcina variabilis]|uniref:hypothetical protein n=1 Tax=Desulfosarcina variabilis TaxID=2300 RepID=UPI003AFAA714
MRDASKDIVINTMSLIALTAVFGKLDERLSITHEIMPVPEFPLTKIKKAE